MNPNSVTPKDITAVIDSREQLPLDLAPMKSISKTLEVGDYSAYGLERVVSIERKTLGDLVACCGRERARFQRELNRLRGWPVNAVVIESSWRDIEKGEWRSKLNPNQVLGSLTSWIAQGNTIIMAENREMAARIIRNILFYSVRYRLRETADVFAAIVAEGVA